MSEEDTNLIEQQREPVGASVPPARMPDFNKAAKAAIGTPNTPPTGRSFFVDDKSSYADYKEIEGQKFYFDILSDDVKKQVENAPRVLCERLGITYRDLISKDLILTLEQQEAKRAFEGETQEVVINDALRNWTLPRPCCPSERAKLHPDIKRDLSEAIIAFTFEGVNSNRFRLITNTMSAAGK